eukprot:3003010-Pyramimonas_sp.AAC.1
MMSAHTVTWAFGGDGEYFNSAIFPVAGVCSVTHTLSATQTQAIVFGTPNCTSLSTPNTGIGWLWGYKAIGLEGYGATGP